MNRIIKFRAWDHGHKVMHTNFQWVQSGDAGNDWICFVSDQTPWPGKEPVGIVLNNPFFSQQLTKMQGTGLLDKKKVEIYEGDIVRDSMGSIWIVVFLEGCFWLRRENYRTTNSMMSWPDHCYPIFRVDHSHHSEVMGDIYRNPELIPK